MPIVDEYFKLLLPDKLLPETIVIDDIKFPHTSLRPIDAIERLTSFGKTPPFRAAPILFGATTRK